MVVQYSRLQRSLEWISHTRLFAYAPTHVAMARLSLLSLVTLCFSLHPVHEHTHTKVCPSYIYTYVTFWLFTFVVLMGLTLRLFTNIASRVGYLHNFSFPFPILWIVSSSSHWRDIFPTDLSWLEPIIS